MHLCLSLQIDEEMDEFSDDQIGGDYLFCLHNNEHMRGSRGRVLGVWNVGIPVLDPLENHKTFQTTLNVGPS